MLGRRVVAEARGRGHDVVAADLAEFDLTDPAATDAFVREAAPDAVVNCAAYTQVDRAEEDEPLALAVNGAGAGNVARAATAAGARVVHVSTDYVFDGKRDRPWVESDPTGPLGAYGRTKLAGEHEVLAAGPDHAVVRTAWLFGAGGPNFPDTMLRLAREHGRLRVVTDQVGSPTWTGHLAEALVACAETPDRTGVFHAAGAGPGVSWHAYAQEIVGRARLDVPVDGVTSDAFPRPAPRPAWSVLGSERPSPLVLPPWQDGLQAHLDEEAT
jgi:dTDP-4-dehydrorhamnose reductase